MPYQVTITPQETHMYVVVTGDANFQNAKDMWLRIAAACNQHQCFNVLGEQNLNNPISTLDAWNHQDIFLEAGITAKYRIAWVDKNPQTFEATQFIRRVLYNRDIGYGKLFSNSTLAKKWLLKLKEEAKV